MRIFECKNCGHKVRLGSSRCGYCYRPTPLLNRKVIWVLLPIFIAVIWSQLR